MSDEHEAGDVWSEGRGPRTLAFAAAPSEDIAASRGPGVRK
jgi:hypothetical protein